MGTPSVSDNKLMDTIVIEDEEEEDEKGELSLKLSEEADEKKNLVDPSSVGDKRIVSNPLYEGSDDSRDSAGGSEEAGQSSNPLHEEDIKNESVVILDDEVIVVNEKKASGPGLSARNIQTMSKRNPFPRSGPSFKPSTAPDFIPLFSSFGSSRINGQAKETIIQHVARGTRDKARGIYRENRRRNMRRAPAPYHRPERSQPIVAEGPTMMASSHSRRGEKGSLRPIVLDGCNIAMYHGRNKVFSVRGIEIVLEYFLKRGHQKVVTFMPQEKSSGRSPSDRQRMEKMVEEGHLVYTASRRVNNQTISCYDDTYILDYAAQHGAVVVTRDNYRDLANRKPDWDQVIREMILMPTFVGDDIMWPHDPLGRDGLSLDDFLKF